MREFGFLPDAGAVLLPYASRGPVMKFSVTPELALLLKTLRAQSGVSAKELAETLEKSPSYVSKLENGEVKSIYKDVLACALTAVAGGGDFFEDVLPAAVRMLTSFMARERLLSQVWLLQFDVVERMVSVPVGMAADIKGHLADAGVTVPELVRRVNSNADSGLGAGFPANEFVSVDYEGSPRLTVRVELSEDRVERALAEEKPLLSYLDLMDIAFVMFRLVNYPEAVGKLPPDEAVTVLRCTASFMDQWGLHSLTGFSHFVSSDEFVAHQEPLARTNPRIVQRIAEVLDEASRHDSIAVTNQLNAFYETLQWDPAFALKLLSIPFSDLGDVSFRTKRCLLADIRDLVDRYDQLPDFEKRLEEY